METEFVTLSEEYFERFYMLFDEVCREGLWYSRLTAFPHSETIEFLHNSVKKAIPFLLVKDKDRIVGWCDVQPREEGTGSFAIGLKDGYREKGIGRQLINRIIEMARRYGYKKVILEVRAVNLRAINLYKSVGFTETQYCKEGLSIGENKYDIIKMSMDI